MKPIKYILIIIPLALFLFLIISTNSNATVTISNVSPANNSIHVDIIETSNGGYVNLSWQLNDSTGGGDMEFYMDVLLPKWNGSNGGFWKYYREIWINNTGGSSLSNVYINITLNNTNFDFSKAQPDGDDIRFIDNATDINSGNDLTKNTVRLWYNSSNQSAKFSVKIPNIPANTKYRIWIAYGNDKATWTGKDEFYIYDDFSTDTTSEYERFDPNNWDYYFRYGYGAKTIANWTMEITTIDALNWGGGIYIGMTGENGTTITNGTYFAIRYNTDIGATETQAVVNFYCSNSSGSTNSGSWDKVLTEGNTYYFYIIVTDTYCRGIIKNSAGTEVFNKTLTSYIPDKLEYQWIGFLNYNDAGSVFEWKSDEGGYLHLKCAGGGNSGNDNSYIDTKLYYYKLGEKATFTNLSYSIGIENTPSIPVGSEWTNRLHLVNQNNGSWYHDEDTFNHINTTYYWRINAKDGTTGEWTNETYHFRTDAKPSVFPVSPENNSYVETGNQELYAVVYHPDYIWGFTGLSFDGSNDQVVVNHSDDFNVTSFTVDVYLNVTTTPSTNSYNAIIGHKDSSGNGYGVALYENHTGIMYLLSDINGVKTYCNCTYLVVDKWYHIVVTYDANTHIMSFYINGNLINSKTVNEVPSPAVADLMIGGPPYTGLYKNFNGIMDYIRLYNRSLTPSEVKANFYGKNDNCVKDGLIGYWKFDEGTGTTAYDSSGRNHDGTLENGVSWTSQNGGSTVYYGKIYNVTFYEYPSGRIIGWNYSSTGWTNGQIVKCNSTFYTPYEGTKYYWYAKAMDDEYWSDNSSVFHVETYYNNTEPSIAYYSLGAEIYVNPPYTTPEPDIVYYSLGAEIRIYDKPHYHNPSPNGTTNEPLSVKLTVYVNKTGEENYWNFSFLTNCTSNGSWSEIGRINNVKVLNSSLVEVSLWWSGLDWNTTYYWRVSAYNSTIDRYSNSSVYSFTTKLTDPEPNISYYSIGSQIYVQPEYTTPEPSIVYYSLGAEINVYNIANLSNPYPANGSTNIWLSTPLKIQVNKTGNASQLDIIFETNCTANGSWVEIGRLMRTFPPNATVSIWWSGLDWNTTYYWRVRAINTTTGMTQYSDVYHFTTLRNDSEPNIVYYSVGADIYVNPIYTTPEPSIAYYSIGANLPISPPHPRDPIPANNTAYGSNDRDFSVFIYDVWTNDTIDKVEFYIDGNKYGEVTNITANTRASIHVSGLTNYTWHTWYVKVYDGNWVVTSDIWRYRPANHPPVIDENPVNGSTNVAVYRKLVSGEWQHFVRLYWNLTDGDGDGMSFILWVKDPSTGNWIQRWTILDYSMHNGSYYQDEKIFNETGQTYYWKVWVSDGKNETTQIYHFYTQFFIDFWWYPEYPTTDDVVHFYSITQGADDFRWDFGDGTNVTGVNETTHRYLVAGYYNVTLWVYNATNHVWGHLTKTIRIDRNITLTTPKEGIAGYNWEAWQGKEINSSYLAKLLNLSKGYWIHYYNSSSDEWEGYFVGYNAGINSHIKNWDATVIVVDRNKTTRINATEIFNYSLKNETFVKYGYNVVSWSAYSVKNSSDIPLDNGEWVYKWDNVNRTWKAYLKGVGGDNFKVKPYDVIVTYMKSSRVWRLMFGG